MSLGVLKGLSAIEKFCHNEKDDRPIAMKYSYAKRRSKPESQVKTSFGA